MNNPAPVLVGIIGPLTEGKAIFYDKVVSEIFQDWILSDEIQKNIKQTCAAANELTDLGATCYIPHLNAYWHICHQHEEDFWISQSLSVLSRCDLIFKLPGESAGTRKEEAHLRAMGLPVTESMTCANALIKATTELRKETGRMFLNLPTAIKTRLCNELDAMSFLFLYYQSGEKENFPVTGELPAEPKLQESNRSPEPSGEGKASTECSDLLEGEEKERQLQP